MLNKHSFSKILGPGFRPSVNSPESATYTYVSTPKFTHMGGAGRSVLQSDDDDC